MYVCIYVRINMHACIVGARRWQADRWAKQEFLNPPQIQRQIKTALNRSDKSTEFLLHERERAKRNVLIEREAVRKKMEQMYDESIHIPFMYIIFPVLLLYMYVYVRVCVYL